MVAAAKPVVHVVGRDSELALVERFLDEEGGSRALVVTGNPGVGKTTLWEAGVGLASEAGYRTLLTRATEPEIQLSFVALADLLEDVDLQTLEGLPAPQLRALKVALLRAEPGEEPPDSLAVSAGFTSVLRALAHTGPLLVAVDDVPWLDRPSADALSFAARRLAGPGIRFLLARRPGESPLLERAFGHATLERVDVGPLSFGATRTLLFERLGLTLPRRVLRRVFEASGGNPLFTLEVGRMLRERGTPEIGAELPLPELVDDLFGERIAGLDASVRRALLALSLAGGLTRLQLAALLDPLAIEDAVSSGVLVVDGARVRVSHPLLAAAARRHSTAAERRELHLDLARTVTDETLRAQHLALASATPEAELAAAVAEAAASAIARGAAHDAIELAEQALRLTPPQAPEYVDRLLDLARYLVIAGEMPRARELLHDRAERLPRGAAQARAFLVLSECAETVDEAERLLESAIAESENEPALRASALANMSILLSVTRFRRLDQAERLGREALEVASAAGPEQERWALCALAWLRLLRGRPMDELVDRCPPAPRGSSLYETSLERLVATRIACHGDVKQALALFGRLRRLAEERGEARSGGIMHNALVDIELRAGNVLGAVSLMTQSDEWSAFENPDELRAPRMAILEAVRGRADEAERWAAETIRLYRSNGMFREQLEGWRARGLAALLRHEPEQAAEALRPIWKHMVREGIEEPGVWPVQADLVEALVELGELEEAGAVTDWLERLSVEQEHAWGLASAKRCRALIALAAGWDERAAQLLGEAAEAYGAMGMGFDQARSLLVLGRTARRHRKRAVARRSLEQAVRLFESLGDDGWAEEGRAELERVGARRPAGEGTLTPSEERVARLAAEGLSNKQVAAQLYVSIHTVEKHLSRVYAKLGVHSRGQLAKRLGAPA